MPLITHTSLRTRSAVSTTICHAEPLGEASQTRGARFFTNVQNDMRGNLPFIIIGVNGITGIISITGITGITGIDGITGITGITGIDGITGITGIVGVKRDISLRSI